MVLFPRKFSFPRLYRVKRKKMRTHLVTLRTGKKWHLPRKGEAEEIEVILYTFKPRDSDQVRRRLNLM